MPIFAFCHTLPDGAGPKVKTYVGSAFFPLMRYLLLPPITNCLVTVISSRWSYPTGLFSLSELSNTIDTVALVTPAWPCLYTSSWRLFARTFNQRSHGKTCLLLFKRLSHQKSTERTTRTCCKFCIPRTKQIESKMLDFPLPFNPVIALNWGSN